MPITMHGFHWLKIINISVTLFYHGRSSSIFKVLVPTQFIWSYTGTCAVQTWRQEPYRCRWSSGWRDRQLAKSTDENNLQQQDETRQNLIQRWNEGALKSLVWSLQQSGSSRKSHPSDGRQGNFLEGHAGWSKYSSSCRQLVPDFHRARVERKLIWIDGGFWDCILPNWWSCLLMYDAGWMIGGRLMSIYMVRMDIRFWL